MLSPYEKYQYADDDIRRIWAADHPDTVDQAFNGRHGIYILVDTDAESPREWNNLGTMVCWHRKYRLGEVDGREQYGHPDNFLLALYNQIPDVRRLDCDLTYHKLTARVWNRIHRKITEHYVILPLYLMDHSGLRMSTYAEPFRIRDFQGWDWGQVGWIYVSKDQVIKEYGSWTPETQAQAAKVLEEEVETYDLYLSEQVYGYILTEVRNGEEIEIDSCWGFYGDDIYQSLRGILKDVDPDLAQAIC